ncbi:hypothetical protein ACFO4O_01560 [Glaciecola siphonariae]|uniref:Uncharacterized protein n=1 Tax=Glaciecola siphonariae TaxID=521012 RepID=A0ABV9LQU5_9ALTE
MQKVMHKLSLPSALRLSLKQHAMSADIPDDDELNKLVHKLDDLNVKIEAIKAKALANRAKRDY